MSINDAVKLYKGFYITRPVGNNAFSFDRRRHKRIYVPPLIEGTLDDLILGSEIVFSEVEDGVEKNRTGLKHFVYCHHAQKEIFIFDNHNHAFFFWWRAFYNGKITPGRLLVHIDQHSDMRRPEDPPRFDIHHKGDLKAVFGYTNFNLNVGNFIQPAVQAGLFSQVKIIDSSAAFKDAPPRQNFVLDIDMDVFAPELDYITDDLKIAVIKKYIQQARLITVATSPFFIDQNRALQMVRELLDDLQN